MIVGWSSQFQQWVSKSGFEKLHVNIPLNSVSVVRTYYIRGMMYSGRWQTSWVLQ
jgi:hypothetical protein